MPQCKQYHIIKPPWCQSTHLLSLIRVKAIDTGGHCRLNCCPVDAAAQLHVHRLAVGLGNAEKLAELAELLLISL